MHARCQARDHLDAAFPVEAGPPGDNPLRRGEPFPFVACCTHVDGAGKLSGDGRDDGLPVLKYRPKVFLHRCG
jgi:hypothetical protein